jgi:hypothetical protein
MVLVFTTPDESLCMACVQSQRTPFSSQVVPPLLALSEAAFGSDSLGKERNMQL